MTAHIIQAADLAGVLFVAVAAMFAGSLLFVLLWLPTIIRAVRAEYADDERAAAAASGDDQHPEWRDVWSDTPIFDDLALERLRAEVDEWGRR